MRLTIQLDDHLWDEAKPLARRTGRTLGAVVEDAIRESLTRRKAMPPRKNIRLITDGGNGLQPGVSLDNNAELLDIMNAETTGGNSR